MICNDIDIKAAVGKTEIVIGGKKIEGVTKIDVSQEVGEEIPTMTLTCKAKGINLALEGADVQVSFEEGWISVDKLLPDELEEVLCIVKSRRGGYHYEVLYRQFFEESDALYEGVYWCSYRDINIEAMEIEKVVAWKPLKAIEEVVTVIETK